MSTAELRRPKQPVHRPGYIWAALRDPDASILDHRDGKRCMQTEYGERCHRGAVAYLGEGDGRRRRVAYCVDHLGSRWIEDGRVMTWLPLRTG